MGDKPILDADGKPSVENPGRQNANSDFANSPPAGHIAAAAVVTPGDTP